MVLQRGPGTAMIWGFGPVGAEVQTEFRDDILKTKIEADGVWRQILPSTEATMCGAGGVDEDVVEQEDVEDGGGAGGGTSVADDGSTKKYQYIGTKKCDGEKICVSLLKKSLIRSSSSRSSTEEEDHDQHVDVLVENDEEKICLTNILFGDVFLCGGQSNMSLTPTVGIIDQEEELNAADNHDGSIRIFQVGNPGVLCKDFPYYGQVDCTSAEFRELQVGGIPPQVGGVVVPAPLEDEEQNEEMKFYKNHDPRRWRGPWEDQGGPERYGWRVAESTNV